MIATGLIQPMAMPTLIIMPAVKELAPGHRILCHLDEATLRAMEPVIAFGEKGGGSDSFAAGKAARKAGKEAKAAKPAAKTAARRKAPAKAAAARPRKPGTAKT